MPTLELSYLRFGPPMKAKFGFRPQRLNALGRIVGAQPDFHRVLHYRAQYFSEAVGAIGFLSSSCHQLDDVLAAYIGGKLVAVFLPVPVR
jgi:hypothetical protein